VRGTFVGALLQAGASAVYAFEPFPASVDALRAAYADDPKVTIFDLAVGFQDGEVSLHVVEDKTGRLADAYHSLVPFDETPTLKIVGRKPVTCRSLDSLVADGSIPSKVGILKIDTERNDLAVLQGMGQLTSSVVVLEYWNDLPETVGPSPYQVSDVVDLMVERGYSTFVTVKRHDQFETLAVNDACTRPCDWGNLLFFHDAVLPRLAPTIYATVAAAQNRLVDRACFFADEAQKRLALVEATSAEASGKEAVIAALTATARERLELIEELDVQARNGVSSVDLLSEELRRKERVIADLTATAHDRLQLIDRLDDEVERLNQELERLRAAALLTRSSSMHVPQFPLVVAPAS
jgi:FkbM family methyltransferase